MSTFKSNYEYRQHLIRNGSSVLSKIQTDAYGQTIFCKYGEDKKENKYIFKNIHDTYQPNGFENSDLKSNYIQQCQNMSKGNDIGMTSDQVKQFKENLRDQNNNV